MPELVRLDAEGAIGTLTLTDPDRLNALSPAMLEELIDAAARCDALPDVRVVLVEGAGRAFCAGFDLGALAGSDGLAEHDQVHMAGLGGRMAAAISGMRAVTIAGLHGWVVGGGVVLAGACDLRYAAAGTRFRIPEVAMGLPLGWGGLPMLVDLVGPAVAKDWVLTCREWDAEEAHLRGFVNEVVPADSLSERTRSLAGRVAAMPGGAVRSTKRGVSDLMGPAGTDEELLAALRSEEFRVARDRYLGDQ